MRPKSEPRRILFIDSGSGYGGSSRFMYYLFEHLNKIKFKSFLAFYFPNNRDDTIAIQKLGIPICWLSSKQAPSAYVPVKWLMGKSNSSWLTGIKVALRLSHRLIIIEIPLIWQLLKLLKKEQINLVILNNDVHYHMSAVIGARLAHVPCICRKAGGIGEGRKIKKLLVPLVDCFIAVSKATATDQCAGNFATKRLVTVHEGVSFKILDEKFSHSSHTRNSFSDRQHNKVVGNVSRFVPGKGQMEILEAAALVVKRYPAVHFVLVGDGGLFDSLNKKTAELGLTDHVEFSGWKENVSAIYSEMDIFVHCPTTCIEGLGIANLEAMAMGKPCVVSDNGGLPDAVLDGVTGYVVPPGDIHKLADAILRLLEDDNLACEFGKNARRRAEEEFDMAKNVRRLEALFEEYAR